jgi:hypothetical protein
VPLTLDTNASVKEFEADLPGIVKLAQSATDDTVPALLIFSIASKALDGPPTAVAPSNVENAREVSADRPWHVELIEEWDTTM